MFDGRLDLGFVGKPGDRGIGILHLQPLKMDAVTSLIGTPIVERPTHRLTSRMIHLCYPFHHTDGPAGMYASLAENLKLKNHGISDISVVQTTGYCPFNGHDGANTCVAIRLEKPPNAAQVRINGLSTIKIMGVIPQVRIIKDILLWNMIFTDIHTSLGRAYQSIAKGPLTCVASSVDGRRIRMENAANAYRQFLETNTSGMVQSIFRDLPIDSRGEKCWFPYYANTPEIADYFNMTENAISFFNCFSIKDIANILQSKLDEGYRPTRVILCYTGIPSESNQRSIYLAAEQIITGSLPPPRSQDANHVPLATCRANVVVFADFQPHVVEMNSGWSIFMRDSTGNTGHVFTPSPRIGALVQQVSPIPRIIAMDELNIALSRHNFNCPGFGTISSYAEAREYFYKIFSPMYIHRYWNAGREPIVWITGHSRANAHNSMDTIDAQTAVLPMADKNIRIGDVIIQSVPLNGGTSPTPLELDGMRRFTDAERRVVFSAVNDWLRNGFAGKISNVETETPIGKLCTDGWVLEKHSRVIEIDFEPPDIRETYKILWWQDVHAFQTIRLRASDILDNENSWHIHLEMAIRQPVDLCAFIERDPTSNFWMPLKKSLEEWSHKAVGAADEWWHLNVGAAE